MDGQPTEAQELEQIKKLPQSHRNEWLWLSDNQR